MFGVVLSQNSTSLPATNYGCILALSLLSFTFYGIEKYTMVIDINKNFVYHILRVTGVILLHTTTAI